MPKSQYIGNPVKRYLEDLSARRPAPGGGSASALVGAVGCALISMVANFTVGKRGYERVQKEARGILSDSEKLRRRLAMLLDEDVDAYLSWQKGKTKEACRRCAAVPQKVISLSKEALTLCAPLRNIGNKNLISDVDCAEAFLEAAIRGAEATLELNDE